MSRIYDYNNLEEWKKILQEYYDGKSIRKLSRELRCSFKFIRKKFEKLQYQKKNHANFFDNKIGINAGGV